MKIIFFCRWVEVSAHIHNIKLSGKSSKIFLPSCVKVFVSSLHFYPLINGPINWNLGENDLIPYLTYLLTVEPAKIGFGVEDRRRVKNNFDGIFEAFLTNFQYIFIKVTYSKIIFPNFCLWWKKKFPKNFSSCRTHKIFSNLWKCENWFFFR